ncbi:MAG: hypothetical protein Unbinned7794contig1000_44 [Prokaryotic dsDNA virus sp.]|nr:MAG: hypothetical protein Unbinned7794contig1000_44 [Prokaryotic dsDNA virus sp.]|tara:strand:+ start:102 stop:443 length:342 start_codon:yes stop_codon:yes gene_type:complete
MTELLKPYVTPDGQVHAPNESEAVIQTLFLGTATTAESITLTADTNVARIQADQDIWYEFDATAAAPTTEQTTGSSIFLPAGQERLISHLRGVTAISCVGGISNTSVNLLEWG